MNHNHSANLAGRPLEILATLIPPLDRGANRWRLGQWARFLPQIAAREPNLLPLPDDQLRKHSLSLRYRAKSGEPLSRLLVEAFALVREAGRRTLNMRHFDVQILAGIAMCRQSIVEMQTGEGKTLTATLPMYVHALAGKGCHLATINDYLARRDAELMAPLYRALGMTVGVIETPMSQAERRQAYRCDVTYGTAKEFGFDFLRDRLLLRRIASGQSDFLGGMLGERPQESEKPVQRPPFFALVDEADSILIDEARTPLIISALPSGEQALEAECYCWSAAAAVEFVDRQDYELDREKKTVELTRAGRQKARSLPKPPALSGVGNLKLYRYLERAVLVRCEYHRDQQYVVRDGKIVIVDEFTGRLAEGRKWRDGLHQAVEAKEGVPVTVDAGQAARVTVQDLFLRYEKLAGMTGTALDSAAEMRRIYHCHVIPVPTHRPPARKCLPTQVFGTEEAKWKAVVDEVCELQRQGRPVLIGTRSIDKSDVLSRMLAEHGVEHQVLNAHRVAEEAEIVKEAGGRGKVTVSTNMAGRGTDIRLGPGVKDLGGLHVILTEMHDAARVDRQLVGRCGRQGDPGTYRQYLALDDELLLAGLLEGRSDRLKAHGRKSAAPLDRFRGVFRRAQRKVEATHFRQRRSLMYFEQQRKKMHEQMGQDPYLDAAGA